MLHHQLENSMPSTAAHYQQANQQASWFLPLLHLMVSVQRLASIIAIAYQRGGVRVGTRTLVILPLFFAFTHLTLLLDNIIFPFYRRQQVKTPVFIVGLPRSGTTLMHKTFVKHENFLRFDTWDIIFPAITAKIIFSPIKWFLKYLKLGALVPKEVGHEVHLFEPEEEEFFFQLLFNSQTLFGLFALGKGDKIANDIVYAENSKIDIESVRWLKRIFQRKLFTSGNKQIVAQIHMSIMRLPHLLDVFPDAKFIVSIRDPKEMFPSHLHLTNNLLNTAVPGISNEMRTHILNSRIFFDKLIISQILSLTDKRILTDANHVIVKYNELMKDYDTVIRKVMSRLDISVSDTFWHYFSKMIERQKSYTSGHGLRTLSDFPITESIDSEEFLEESERLFALPTNLDDVNLIATQESSSRGHSPTRFALVPASGRKTSFEEAEHQLTRRNIHS